MKQSINECLQQVPGIWFAMICHLDGCFPVFLIQPFCKLKRIETIWACGTGWPKPPKHWISQEHLSSKWFLLMWKVTPGTAQLMPGQSLVIKSRMSHLQMPDYGPGTQLLGTNVYDFCLIQLPGTLVSTLHVSTEWLEHASHHHTSFETLSVQNLPHTWLMHMFYSR